MTADDRFRLTEPRLLLAVAGRLAEREYGTAVELAGFGVALFPDCGRLWELGGLAAWAADDPAAVPALEEAVALVPLHPLARIALADGYERAGLPAVAGVIWDFLNEAEAGDLLLGCLRDHAGADWQLAFRAFRALTDHDPGNPLGWYGLGECLGRLGAAPERVLEPFRLAAEIEPGNPRFALAAATAHAAGGSPVAGAGHLRAVCLAAVRCPCWLRRAEGLFAAAGDWRGAAACRERLRMLADDLETHRREDGT